MLRRPLRRAGPLLWALLPLCTAPLAAQHGGEGGISLGAQAIPLLTHATPVLHGESRTEGYLTQPMVMARAATPGGALELRGMLNLEGLTLADGELNAGIWGEGFVDRRHPHTYLHELMGVARLGRAGGVQGSLAAGRGFVPYGTDDPMARPLVKYPANHHYAQILERWVAAAAVRAGPVGVEGALFNGDEPEGPTGLGRPGRFGDSWAARLTLWPLAGVEVQGSHARVASPELPGGEGNDHHQWSASARWESPAGQYALAEWARSTDYDDGREGGSYHTLLAEAAAPLGPVRLAARLERTDRPEEERLLDPFRTASHAGAHLIGVTRWEIATVQLSAPLPPAGPLRAAPFLEVARLRARETIRPSFFEPARFYGAERMWSLSVGARLALGAGHGRAGRYGAALPPSPAAGPTHHQH